MASLKAARCRLRSEKKSEPECPYRGVFRLALQRVPSNPWAMGVRQGFGREGEGVVALAWGFTYFTV